MSGIDLTAAVEAALEAHRHPRRMLTNTSDGNQHDRMEAALEAALPHLEQRIRKQVAAEIEAEYDRRSPLALDADFQYNSGVLDGLDIAEQIARTRKDT